MSERNSILTKAVLHGIILVCAVLGLVFQAVFFGIYLTDMFMFFAPLVNIAIVVVYGLILYKDIVLLLGRNSGVSIPSVIYGGVMLNAVLVWVIYLSVLLPAFIINNPAEPQYRLLQIQDILLQFLVPVLVLADYIFFAKKGNFKWSGPLIWAAPFVVYLGFVFLYSTMGAAVYGGSGMSPYFFLDAATIGWGNVVLISLALLVMFVGLGFMFYILDTINWQALRERLKNSKPAKSRMFISGLAEDTQEKEKPKTKQITTKQGTYTNPYIKKKPERKNKNSG
ncbi:MAG: Pr6Pr family membrane protein [Firmicutes bacterium]|nr:Pr6Pr family membrane protein [Bacillota bacterium]